MLPGKGFPKKTIQERLESRKEALEKLLARSKQKQLTPRPHKKPRAQPVPTASEESAPSSAPIVTVVEAVSLVPPQLGTSDGTGKRYITPWGRKLAIKLLECARDRKISLCLIWPAEVDTVAPLHAIASLGAVLW